MLIAQETAENVNDHVGYGEWAVSGPVLFQLESMAVSVGVRV